MTWHEHFIPLDPADARNEDRADPGGDRIRIRINRDGGRIVDYVVQYETPIGAGASAHATVLRSDGTHDPHYDLYYRSGRVRTVALPANLSPAEAITWAIDDIKRRWPDLRDRFFVG